MFTPQKAVYALRACAILSASIMAVLMLGPFQGLEHVFGLSDKAAHGIAFFSATLGAFCIAPHSRRHDLALVVLGFAVVCEILQCFVGRSMSLMDLLADVTGIGIALIPGAVENFRRMVRTHPHLTFAQIRLYDRRVAGRRASVASQAAAVMPVSSDRAR